jgi:hypothetical protein
MLTKDERIEVEDEFVSVLITSDVRRPLLKSIFKVEGDRVLRQLPSDSVTNESFAADVLGVCLADRWSQTPSLLEQLLQYLVINRALGKFAALLARVQAQTDPNPDPYHTSWVMEVHPFFDRSELREHGRSLLEKNTRPVLRVSGLPHGFGRSYSRKFFEHLQMQLSWDAHVLSAELSPETGPSYQIRDLLLDLISQMGLTDDPPAPSASSYPNEASRWLLARIRQRAGKWIIVLDGFGQEGLKPEVRAFIESLASLLQRIEYKLRIRLVLVDYPHKLPQLTPLEIIEDQVQPPEQVTSSDLEPCIREWDRQTKAAGKPGVPDTEISALAQGIIQKVPAGGKARLIELNQQLQKLLTL